MRIEQCFCQNDGYLLAIIAVVGLHGHIVNLRPYTERGIAGQCPRSGSPCQEVRSPPLCHFRLWVLYLELPHYGCIFYVTVASGLVQLVRTESCTGSGRIRLYGISFIKQSFLVELFQQPPQGFDIAVVVSYIGVIHVHPVAHLVGQVFPLFGELHDVLAAGSIVFCHGNSLANILFGYTECLFHTQFHRQSVSIPSGFALYLKSLHRLVTAENVLNGASHYVVNARHTIGRGGAFEKHERRTTFTFCHTLDENLVFVPFLQHFSIHFGKVKFRIFGKLLTHLDIYYLTILRFTIENTLNWHISWYVKSHLLYFKGANL